MEVGIISPQVMANRRSRMLLTHGGSLAETLLDSLKGNSVSMPVFITVSKVLDFSSHKSLFPTTRSRLTSSKYFRMAKLFVVLRPLDLRIVLLLGKWILAKG